MNTVASVGRVSWSYGTSAALQQLLMFLLITTVTSFAHAHEMRPAYLELREADDQTYDVKWKVPAQGDDMRLALDIEFPEGSLDLTARRGVFSNHAFTQEWRVRVPKGLAGKSVRVVGLDSTMTDALARIERSDGTTQVSRLTPASSLLFVDARPGKIQVALTYVRLGIEHILTGYDHLLFVLALILIVRDRRLLIMTITAFTVAHSITLALATLGFVHVPSRPVEATIAVSILLLAVEAVRINQGNPSLTSRWPWIVAFMFGLLHGFGFANALTETGLPQGDIPLALFTFNVGVEVGQLMFITFVLIALDALKLLNWRPISGGRAASLTSYAIGSMAGFWMIDRIAAFWA
jgi:hydrogenase/urease accessory protein HupE